MKVHDKFLFRKFFHQYIKQFFLFSFIFFCCVLLNVYEFVLLKKRVTYFRRYFLSLYNNENHQIYKWIFLIVSTILLLNVICISFIIFLFFFLFLQFHYVSLFMSRAANWICRLIQKFIYKRKATPPRISILIASKCSQMWPHWYHLLGNEVQFNFKCFKRISTRECCDEKMSKNEKKIHFFMHFTFVHMEPVR